MKIGFIINPISGMGGRVGLKGTDNLAELAASLGGEPVSLVRAEQALHSIEEEDDLFFLTCSGIMGENVLEKTRFSYEVIYYAPERTTAEDTKKAALKMLGSGCDLLLFSGGDGTAGDIVSAVDKKIPVLGIPAGVKIFSPIFCITPEECGRIVSTFTETSVRDVLDIDEEAYRNNELNVRIKGEVLVPVSPGVQSGKATSGSVDAKIEIAERIIDDHRAHGKDVLYIIGPGTTTMEVKKKMGIDGTLLGVDAVRNGNFVKKDASEKHLLDALHKFDGKVAIIVSPIGSQGFIFGRGNQQISPEVIKRADEIMVIASPDKLEFTPALHVDTGDPELDKKLRGYVKVLSGYHDFKMMKVV
ncbi:MAG: ATP-NAD kinase family protein [Euryarchaeota archaeon]|nr:ATP-NAD kinase family protein [Euryarchaeota archaeon]MBU4454796.1 ATP-NAD kinase family protein [Euryarchaeota archaeon]MCG2738037.1 ATP-NAD kinase family protein [Candidatus Methanoperedenaceae archaeon]